MLLAFVWPASSANVQKKKTTAKRPVVAAKKPLARKKVVVTKKRRRGPVASVPSKPKNFATVPVSTELKACAMKDRPAGESALCLNCAEQALSTANAFTGLKYKRGGTNPNVGFDCSGFVRHVYLNSCGRELPRTAREQFEVGEPVEKDQLQRGDLVFFSSRQGWHVGIYTGNNSFIHSPNRRESVRESSLDTPYYKRMYKGARRLSAEIAPMLAAEAGGMPDNQ